MAGRWFVLDAPSSVIGFETKQLSNKVDLTRFKKKWPYTRALTSLTRFYFIFLYRNLTIFLFIHIYVKLLGPYLTKLSGSY